jgi:hypothetical protein
MSAGCCGSSPPVAGGDRAIKAIAAAIGSAESRGETAEANERPQVR